MSAEAPLPAGRSQSGFMLLEVVVALAIAAIALTALFQSGSAGLLSAAVAARVVEATERAQSHLAAFGRAAAVTEEDRSGEDGGGYRWRLRAAPVARHAADEPATAGAEPLVLYAVDVTISWDDGGRRRSVTLQSLRLGRPPSGE